MGRAAMKRAGLGGIALAVVLLAPVVRAQPVAVDVARSIRLYEEAQALMADGKFPEACSKYAESQQLDPQLGTELHLGACYLKIGKLASALATFRKAADIASARKDRREAAARTQVVKLEPRVPRLVIAVGLAAPPDLEIRCDGEVVSRSMWRTRLAIDAGKHTITAKAAAFETWTYEVDIPAAGPAVRVEVPDLVREQAPQAAVSAEAPAETKPPEATPPPPETPQVQTTAPATTPAQQEVPRSGATNRTVGYVLGGLGVAGIVGGAIAKGMALAKQSDIDAHCNANKACDQVGMDAVSAGSALQTAGYASMLVGAAALGAGIVLVVSNPAGGAASAVMQPVVLHGGAGLSFAGRF